jgi:hypothetical protein
VSPIQLAFLRFIVRRMFVSSPTPFNNSSVLTRSAQLISNILQHHIWKLSRCF